MLITHKINTILVFIFMACLGASAYYYHISLLWLLLPAIIWFIIAAIGSGLVWTGYHIKTYCKNPAEKEKIVAITFDDGPTPETLKVLELLRQYNAKATFFCIGKQIEKYPEIFKQVLAEGHTIGNHTFTHSPNNGFAGKMQWLDELKVTDKLITTHSGKKAKFFRPPYGVTTPYVAQALKNTGHNVIGWNIRSLDAILKDENKIFNRINSRLKPGSIILLHDTSQKSVNVLEQLLVLLKQNKYEAVTVDRLLNIPAYEK